MKTYNDKQIHTIGSVVLNESYRMANQQNVNCVSHRMEIITQGPEMEFKFGKLTTTMKRLRMKSGAVVIVPEQMYVSIMLVMFLWVALQR